MKEMTYGILPLEDKQLLARAIEEKKRRIRENGIKYYTPQDQQLPFHRSIKRIRAVFGANRSGKSVGGATEAVWYATGTHPYKDIPTPNYGRIVCTDFTNGIEKVIIPEVRKWLPRAMLKHYHVEARTMELTNGSTIEFMSYDQDVEKFASSSRHWTWFDEEPPQNIYNECRMRLIDTKGDLWITMTPTRGMTWVYSDIYEKAGIDPNIDIFNLGVYDNPYVDNEEIDMIKMGLSEGEIEARIYGKFVQLSGLIYREFKVNKHLMKRFALPSHWPKICAIDPHPRIPTAILYMAVARLDEFRAFCTKNNIKLPDGWNPQKTEIYIVYDEVYPGNSMLIAETAEVMKAHEGTDYISYRLIDNSANTPDPVVGTTIREEFEKHGIRTLLADKDIPNRIFKVRDRLQTDSMLFFDDLSECIWEIQHYSWDDYKIGKDYKDPKEKPRKKRDHMMDNLGYMCLSSPRYDAPEVYRPSRKTADKDTGY